MKKVYYILITFLMVSCNLSEHFASNNTPYKVIFSKLNNLKVTDTVLVSSKMNAFITEFDTINNTPYYIMLSDSILVSHYGNMLSDSILLNQFEKQNNTRIIQVIENQKANTLVFKDSLLAKDVNLLDRLVEEKDMITFRGQYYGFSMSVKVGIKKAVSKVTKIQSYGLGLKHSGWMIHTDSIYEIENIMK